MDRMLEIGKIVNTHALRGDVKVQPWCDDAEVFHTLEYVYAGNEKLEIVSARLHKNFVILHLKGIEDINKAESYKNKVLTVEREMLGELPEGTYYICDLLGLEVRKKDGSVIGKIEDIIKTGSNDVYVVNNGTKKPVLLPVIDDVIKTVNIAEGYVEAELIKGLIDDDDDNDNDDEEENEK